MAHVAEHDLGAAAYAIKAARAAVSGLHRTSARSATVGDEALEAGHREGRWQREQLPVEIRELVLDDQRARNDICWRVFQL